MITCPFVLSGQLDGVSGRARTGLRQSPCQTDCKGQPLPCGVTISLGRAGGLSVLALCEEAGLEHHIVRCDVLKTHPLQELFRYHVVGQIERRRPSERGPGH